MKFSHALLFASLCLPFFGFSALAQTTDAELARGSAAVQSMAGCYLVDYNFMETDSLMAGYVRDNRVYEVNNGQTFKEWIYADTISPSHIRLQHILFAADKNGVVDSDSFLRHQAEDWEYNLSFLYDFASPSHWNVKDLSSTPHLWTRKITNLDDGLRYQCAASWEQTNFYPEWSCDDYAPIPGRETRDMGRKDYNTLARSTHLIAYQNSWLERQANIKTIDANGTRTPLAREVGKTWYVRLPDSDCAQAKAWSTPQFPYWTLLRQTWEKVLTGDRPFVEKTLTAGQLPRYMKMFDIEDKYSSQDLSTSSVHDQAQADILKLIADYRSN